MQNRPRLIAVLLTIAVFAAAAVADEPVFPDWRAPMIAKFEDELKAYDLSLKANPKSVALYSKRGDRHLFLGQFPEAVADFEKMIELDPSEDAPHWRLGIAYYFAGQFGKSAKQFEKYHAYDGHDRENGIWKFLAQVKADGVEKARAEMLQYAEFDREPFPSLYEMFAGKHTPDEVLAEVEKKGLAGDHAVAFFANYYTGLEEARLGHRDRALALLQKAIDDPVTRAGGYMWEVARLQWEQLRTEAANKP